MKLIYTRANFRPQKKPKLVSKFVLEGPRYYRPEKVSWLRKVTIYAVVIISMH